MGLKRRLNDRLERIKDGIPIPFDEREELPYFYIIVAENETAIRLLEGYIDSLRNKIKIKDGRYD